MLGFTIPGQTIRYNVPVTVLSMLIAIAVVGAGLFIVGYSRGGAGPLLLGGVAIGCGVRRTCPLLCGNAALRRMTPGRQAVRSLGAYFAIIGPPGSRTNNDGGFARLVIWPITGT